MATRRRSRKQRRLHRWATTSRAFTARVFNAAWRKTRRSYRRLRGHDLAVVVDARPREGWCLRRLVRRTARSYARALGAELPERLSIFVQRIVFDSGQVNGLLQAFQSGAHRRYVIQLALTVNGREIGNDELVAALRHQLALALADAIGSPTLSLALDFESVPHTRAGGSILELRSELPTARADHNIDRSPLPRASGFPGGEAW